MMFSAEEDFADASNDLQTGFNHSLANESTSLHQWRVIEQLLQRQEELCGEQRNQSQIQLIENFKFWGEGVAIR